jgi:hypothetical protein
VSIQVTVPFLLREERESSDENKSLGDGFFQAKWNAVGDEEVPLPDMKTLKCFPRVA